MPLEEEPEGVDWRWLGTLPGVLYLSVQQEAGRHLGLEPTAKDGARFRFALWHALGDAGYRVREPARKFLNLPSKEQARVARLLVGAPVREPIPESAEPLAKALRRVEASIGEQQ